MSNESIGLIVLLVGLILMILLIGFIYLWLFIVQKQKLLTHIGVASKKREKRKFSESILSPLLKAGDYVGPTAVKYPIFAKPERDQRLLIRAGNPHGMHLTQFYGLQYVLGFSSLTFFWLYQMLGLPFGLQFMLFFPILSFFTPNIYIWYAAKERQEIISATMPDFLDTVSVALQAGASLDGALQQVARQMDGPLSEEIQRFNREISLGVPRRTAFQHLLDRNNAKELEILVQSLIQGSELGVPVSTTFKVHSADLRATRGFKAKEKAAKASPKITLVTTFVVAPSVFLLVIGLLILNLLYNPDAFGVRLFF